MCIGPLEGFPRMGMLSDILFVSKVTSKNPEVDKDHVKADACGEITGWKCIHIPNKAKLSVPHHISQAPCGLSLIILKK